MLVVAFLSFFSSRRNRESPQFRQNQKAVCSSRIVSPSSTGWLQLETFPAVCCDHVMLLSSSLLPYLNFNWRKSAPPPPPPFPSSWHNDKCWPVRLARMRSPEKNGLPPVSGNVKISHSHTVFCETSVPGCMLRFACQSFSHLPPTWLITPIYKIMCILL